MALLLIFGFILLKSAFGDACPSGKFTESGECCSVCPAGFGVSVECGKEDTKCTPCPKGTFSASADLGLCLPCSQCPNGVPTLATCSAAEDTQCECDVGYFYFRTYGLCTPCSKCKRGEGAVRECGPKGDTLCQVCVAGSFTEEYSHAKACQFCTQCTDGEVEIRPCMPNSDTLCMDKKLHVLSRDSPNLNGVEEVTPGGGSSAPGTPKLTPQDETGRSNNILIYVSVLAAVVLGLIVYVAYKCWRSCKQKKALSKARAAELGASPEGEKLQSDSGVFLDSQSLQDNQPSKGTKRDSKQDTRLYINLPPQRQEEVERLLQEGAGRGWRHLGQALGYEAEQLDLFGRGEAPARTLLSNWALKEGSTLGLLCSALARIERPDVVSALSCPTQGVSVV
ncbi:tumor necrosis factor receptor superfamily member 16 [Stigmatopora argus]